MSVIMTLVRNVRLGSEQYQVASEELDGESGTQTSVTVPALAVEAPVSFPGFVASELVGIWFNTSQPCTLHFVHGAGSVDVTLAAGGTLCWSNTDHQPNPFVGLEITDLEVSVPGSVAAVIVGRVAITT